MKQSTRTRRTSKTAADVTPSVISFADAPGDFYELKMRIKDAVEQRKAAEMAIQRMRAADEARVACVVRLAQQYGFNPRVVGQFSLKDEDLTLTIVEAAAH